MKKNLFSAAKNLFSVALFLLWAFLFFKMHEYWFLSCVYGVNDLIFYIGGFFVLQLADIAVIHRICGVRWCLMACYIAYFLFCSLCVLLACVLYRYADRQALTVGPTLRGLMILCILFDLIGGCFCLFLWMKAGRKREERGK